MLSWWAEAFSAVVIDILVCIHPTYFAVLIDEVDIHVLIGA
jgi:hypothetical protein